MVRWNVVLVSKAAWYLGFGLCMVASGSQSYSNKFVFLRNDGYLFSTVGCVELKVEFDNGYWLGERIEWKGIDLVRDFLFSWPTNQFILVWLDFWSTSCCGQAVQGYVESFWFRGAGRWWTLLNICDKFRHLSWNTMCTVSWMCFGHDLCL